MNEPVVIGNATLYLGDCLDRLKALPDNSVDSIVTDPPYGLRFMSRHWDYDVPSVEVWQEALRVLKPGGHVLSFSGSRTYHRMTVAIEDAGFEIRDQIMWVYGSGFPKSLDVSKAIDRMAGVEREVVGEGPYSARRPRIEVQATNAYADGVGDYGSSLITAPATEAAQQWAGWGTALKPAHEPVCVARKPLIGTVAENVLAHGTGALNIDQSRVISSGQPSRINRSGWDHINKKNADHGYRPVAYETGFTAYNPHQHGRWPTNFIHDGSEEVVDSFPVTTSGAKKPHHIRNTTKTKNIYGSRVAKIEDVPASTGTAARFFYTAKASKADRDEGCEAIAHGVIARSCQAQAEAKRGNVVEAEEGAFNKARLARNHHPTVKPTDLMRYLCRLVTPKGGIVLDPYMGSGSTGKGAVMEGFGFIGIEREAEYLEIAAARIRHAQKQPDMFIEPAAPKPTMTQETLFEGAA